MSSDTFKRALEVVLRHEGGYVNNPVDPGGETNFGISKRSYPGMDIKSLTREAAAQIYEWDYWLPCRCDDMPAALALLVFDGAVNQGRRVASAWLQEVVGTKVDGYIGLITLRAIEAANLPRTLRLYAGLRALGYFSTKSSSWREFSVGWRYRLDEVLRTALGWVA